MASFDTVIRDATIFDGTGAPPVSGDVAVKDGRIVATGRVEGRGNEEIRADGRWLTPGFVDVHTHYDGQATWETRMAPSSNHGVTTAVMGNCGVGFAPCRPEHHDMLVRLLEGVEDIPEVVMTEGLPWTWETFPDYLDTLSTRTLDIDVATQLPHSALRVYVMGERGAEREAPTADDLAEMRRLTTEAIRAGALGVTTSRNIIHRTRAGELAPSLHSEEDELMALADGLRDAGSGVFQLIPEVFGDVQPELALMRRLAVRSGRPLSFTLLEVTNSARDSWREALDWLDETAAAGLPIRGQIYPRPVGVLYGLDLSFHTFSLHPSFRPLADLPLDQKVRALRDPALREKLLSEQPDDPNPVFVSQVRNSVYAYPLGDPPNYEPPLEERIDVRAAREGRRPEEVAYDLLLERDGRAILYLPGANYRNNSAEAMRTMLAHPQTVVALGDGGAHYGMICDASYPTYLLTRWVRDAAAAERLSPQAAIAALTGRPAAALGLGDRGRIAPGLKADLNLVDPDRLTLHAPT
ncbi:MAG: amidohydrolase family protein, partial [Alphaproteobacteria bacterium]|nr:amidohydrolase family protein [Alphaproteobacteria bacterium]